MSQNVQKKFLFTIISTFIYFWNGLFLIATIAYFFSRSTSFTGELIPKLGAIALGLQKLLPTSQIIYSGWALLKGERDSFISVLELLDLDTN